MRGGQVDREEQDLLCSELSTILEAQGWFALAVLVEKLDPYANGERVLKGLHYENLSRNVPLQMMVVAWGQADWAELRALFDSKEWQQ